MLGGPTRFNPDTHQLFFGGEEEIFQCLALAPKSVKLACVERIKDNAPTTKPGKVDLVLHSTDCCNYRETRRIANKNHVVSDIINLLPPPP